MTFFMTLLPSTLSLEVISLSSFCIFFPFIVLLPYYFIYCLGAARHAIAYRIANCFLSLEVEVE
ncbi:hypothetical protein BDW72DRAFT_143373 [Aspergillus terricola var. indicus]